MDLFANEIGMDRAAVRRKNFIQPDQFPYEDPSGLGTASGGAKIYVDSGNYEPALNKAITTAGYMDLDAKKAEAKSRGKLLGMGLSTYIEVCGVAPSKWIGAVGEGWGAAMWESANIRVHLTGKTVVTMGTQPQGQGHETTYSQVVASELGIPMEDIVVQHSDTLGTPFGYGSYGSRTSSVGMTAAIKAAGKIKEKARKYAAHMLEASPDDIEIVGSGVPGQGHARQEEDAPGDRLRARPRVRRARGHGAVSRRDGLPRHAELHVAVRDAHRGRRDRRGDRQGRPRPVRRRRRRRQEDQPAHRRRPAPRRHRPGRRPGALGAGGLQRRRAAPVGLDARLRSAARRPGCRTSSSTRRSRRRRSTRSASRASARRARSPRPRPSPTPSTTRSSPLGIKHLDMPFTAQTVWRAIQSAKGGQA